MILLDTSGVLAAFDEKAPEQAETLKVLINSKYPRIVSPFVVAEADYLLNKRVNRNAQERFLAELSTGAYRLESFSAGDIELALAVMRRYHDLDIGLTDASNVVLANRHRCFDILTLDYRDFRVIRGQHGETFRILPEDCRHETLALSQRPQK